MSEYRALAKKLGTIGFIPMWVMPTYLILKILINMGKEKLLSKTLGQIKKGYGYDTPLGKCPMYQEMKNVATASSTSVLAATTLANGVESVVTENITDPLHYRNLRVVGGSAKVAQVNTLTVGGTFEVGDIFSVTINGHQVVHTVVTEDTDNAGIATALKTLIDALADSAYTCSRSSNVLTLTAAVAGVAFTVTANNATNGGSTNDQTFVKVETVANVVGTNGVVTIKGRDWAGRRIAEQLTLNGATVVVGNIPFMSVYEITLPARSVSGDTVSVGCGDKLGLYRPIRVTADVLSVRLGDYSEETIAAVGASYGTVTPTNVPNNTRDYNVSYLTYLV